MAVLSGVAALASLASGCSPSPAAITPTLAPPTVAATAQVSPPTSTVPPQDTAEIPHMPNIALQAGDHYFSIDGRQGFLFSRNLAGYKTSQYDTQIDLTGLGGSQFVRVHLDSFGMGYSKTGQVDEAWARNWETVFDKAADNGIYVLPVFAAWFDWNDGEAYSLWASNPLNEDNGGPASSARELLIPDSDTQRLWFNWMESLVERWQDRENIIAWEVFSEVNLIPGSTEGQAIEFVNKATALIHNADALQRPVTASLADFGDWSAFYSNDSLEFINIHPYPVSGRLDAYIIEKVRSMLQRYDKPVLIGESGLSFETPDSNPPTLTTADHADLGIKHAVWAGLVSGAMNGRSLWWEDGVAVYFPALSGLIQKYALAELPAASFVRDVDLTGFQPLSSSASSGILGAAVGSERMVLGWFRDAHSEPPNWDLEPLISGQSVSIAVPGAAAEWRVDFYDTATGTDLIGSLTVTRSGDNVAIPLPDFTDDIAFKMYPD